MPRLDEERIAIAATVQAELGDERTLSPIQARSFVRCLQTVWNVETIRWDGEESSKQLADARRLIHAAGVYGEIEGHYSSGTQRCYRRAGELLEWLSRANDQIQTIAPTALLAASAYQLGGLPAMATGLLKQRDPDDLGTELYGRFLQADFDGVLYTVAKFWRRNPELTERDATAVLLDAEEGFDLPWHITIELVRTLGLLADCLRRGDLDRTELALEKLSALDRVAMRGFSDDASLLISLLRHTAGRFREASIYGPITRLGELQPDKLDQLKVIARGQFLRGRGILWASQHRGLDRLINQSSFALCTPTGSGKTLVANLAIVKELLLRDAEPLAPLALYIVPSRALAGEVEAKLSSEMRNEFLVTGLYGGTDWGVSDAWLTADTPTVLVATVEKADALMRYLGPFIIPRLKLLIIDEAHQVVPDDRRYATASFANHSERSIRLEAFVSRLLTKAPHITRIALTAVAGGAANPVARWIEGRHEATAVGLNYRSTRQIIGMLRTESTVTARIQLDLMNGEPLIVRRRQSGIYINLRTPPMPRLPATMRSSLNRFNQTDVLWTALQLKNNDRRILISLAQQPERTMGWYKEALELDGWAEAGQFDDPEDIGDRELYYDTLSACTDYCGEDSYEAALLAHGIASSHGQMPQRLRRLMTALIERGVTPITLATATLTEGVNLPFDLIFVPELKRRFFDREKNRYDVTPISAAEFRNLSGRAGRPSIGKGMEGITLIPIPKAPSSTANGTIPTQERQIQAMRDDYRNLRGSLLADEEGGDGVESPLSLLITVLADQTRRLLGIGNEDFLLWLEQTLPSDISEEAGRGSQINLAKLADTLDDLDAVLLAAVEEIDHLGDAPVGPAVAEAFLSDLWSRTFSTFATAQEAWLETAFIRRGVAIVETLYPDNEERKRLYHYSLPPHLGRRFEAVAEPIKALLEASEEYGVWEAEGRFEVFRSLGALLQADRGFGFFSRGTVGDDELLETWAGVMGWWLNLPEVGGPESKDLRNWQRFVANNLEFRLGVAIGAVVAQAWSDGVDDPLTAPSLETWRETTGLPWFGFWARELLRWGTLDPFVAFAMAQGIEKTRDNASIRREEYETWLMDTQDDPQSEDFIDPQLFLQWQRSLPRARRRRDASREFPAELTGTTGEKGSYTVIPFKTREEIIWFDPAGYELARSALRHSGARGLTRHSDYELVTADDVVAVKRLFDGRKRH